MLKVTDYTYDDLGRLTCEAESSSGVTIQSYSYTYDDYNNRDTLTAAGEDVYTTDYTYNADNRLLTETRTTADSVDTMHYYYDPNGNQTAKVSEHVAEGTGAESAVLTEGVAGCVLSRYNGFNQMVEADIDGTTASYAYFPSGLRASKTVDDTATDFVLDGDQAVLELTGGSITAKYIRGINLICSTIGSATNYYLYNGHGDVVQLANASGMVTKEYDYDAFGNEKDPGTSDTNPFRYCGEYLDLSSGTYYLRSRDYDPTIGRFLSEDTYHGIATDPLSLNLYTYCSNNPIRYVDPSGHWQEGDEYLPDWAISLIVSDTQKWETANATNDTTGMDQAHEHAKAIRQYAARKNTYNMMQFFGVSDPTKIELPDNAMVFLENTRSLSVKKGASIIEGHTVVMDFDKYCEYVFGGVSYGPSGITSGDIDVTGGYVYNVKSPEDYAGLFFGGGGNYPGSANGGAAAFNGVYTKILGGESWLAGSAGGSITYYNHIQSDWVYGTVKINWYSSPKRSYNPFTNDPSL